MIRRGALAAILVLGGCAYYNGMYNAQRLANQAEKAERDNRTFDARNLWAQAEIKADTVLARHGSSKWRDDALLIKGRALASRNDCEPAVAPLEEVIFTAADSSKVATASFVLGGCLVSQREFAEAERRLLGALAHARPDARLRQQAARLLITVYLELGRYPEALDWSNRNPGYAAPADLAVAYAAVGDKETAEHILDSLVTSAGATVDWLAVLPALAARDPDLAVRYTEALVARDSADFDRDATLLMASAEELMAHDTARAVAALERVAASKSAARSTASARMRLAAIALARATTTGDLDSVARIIAPAAAGGSAEALLARQLSQSIRNLRFRVDTLDTEDPQADMELFLSAEVARDSLGTTGVAASLFERLVTEFPTSPYAPKAVLSLALLYPGDSERYRLLLDYVYPDSPYLSFIRGNSTAEFRMLEDSLRLYSFARVSAESGVRRGRPDRPRDPDEVEIDEFDSQDVP